MSHATVMIALDGKTTLDGLADAVEYQMEPFNEDGAMFRDGSRWDWYQIGGRWTGSLVAKPDAAETGLGQPSLVQPQVATGCQVDACRVRDLDLDAIRVMHRADAEAAWDEYEKDKTAKPHLADPRIAKTMFGVRPGDDRTAFVARAEQAPLIHAYAFLKDRVWHEPGRMGWFGGRRAPEGGRDGQSVTRTSSGRGVAVAEVVTYNLPDTDDGESAWSAKFYDTFVKPLPPETWLVIVDYHV